MDVKAITSPAVMQVTSRAAAPVVAPTVASAVVPAQVQLSPQSTRFVQAMAQSSTISPAERQALISTAAMIDYHLPDITDPQAAFTQLAKLGIYLHNTAEEGFPRWSVLTALRAYGASLPPQPVMSEPKPLVAPTKQEMVTIALEQIAQQTRGVSMAQVEQSLEQDSHQTAQKVVELVGNNAQVMSSGVGETPPTEHPKVYIEA